MQASRKRTLTQLGALVVALAVGGWLIAADPPTRPRPQSAQPKPSEPPRLAQTWPKARVVTTPGRLADGTAYAPWLHIDAETSVGTAPTPDGSAQRLLLRTGAGAPRELRRVPLSRFPQFLGFTSTGDFAYWAESTATADGPSETRIWRAPLKTAGAATSLTADTGAAVFFNSQHDLVVADGRVHWVAAAPSDTPETELRSVAVTGGKVDVRRIAGQHQLSTWPWLVSTGGTDVPLELFNAATGQRVRVSTSASEMVGCTPAWCRALVVAGSNGATRFDIMRPDGSDRRRVSGGSASASTSDVAFLDRYEVVSQGIESSQRLLLYDIDSRTLTAVADGVGMVLARGGMLWWSTGEQEATEWHALDLRTLTS